MKKGLFVPLCAVFGLSTSLAESATSLAAHLPVPAKVYDYSKPQYESSYSLLRMIKSDWKAPKDSTIFWMGFDTGAVVSSIDSQWKESKVIGFYENKDMMDYAQANYKTNVEYHLLDYGQHQKKWDQSADLVVSSWMLNKLPKDQHPSVMKNIYSYLKENGEVWFSQPKQGSQLSEARKKVASRENWAKFFDGKDMEFTSYEDSEFVQLMQTAGFKEVEAEEMTHITVFQNRGELLNFVYTALGRYLVHLDEAQAQAFINEVTDAYIADNPPNHRGEIIYSVEMLVASGLK